MFLYVCFFRVSFLNIFHFHDGFFFNSEIIWNDIFHCQVYICQMGEYPYTIGFYFQCIAVKGHDLYDISPLECVVISCEAEQMVKCRNLLGGLIKNMYSVFVG